VDLLRPIRAFDRSQQRHLWLAVPLAVIKKFSDDHGGRLAALVAYYAFFSLFPLLLLMVTILGFVLQGNPGFQQSVEKSVLGQFPVIGPRIQVHALTGHTIALVIGLLGSLWGGLGVTQATQAAFDQVWAIPFKNRPDFIHSRLRGLRLLVVLGTLFLVSSIASGLVTGGLGGPLLKVAAIAFSLLLNFALFFLAFRLMTVSDIATRCLVVGVVVAAILWEVLQVVGGYYIGHIYRRASSEYSQFALVIALLVWLHVGAQVTVYAAEINVVIARKLWPRSLFGDPERPADEKTLHDLAKVEERSHRETVDVNFQRQR
jgi:membrane protein